MKTHHTACKLAWTALMLCAAALPMEAAIIAQDSGSNYTTGTWINGATGGSGFSAWTIDNPGSNTAIESSTVAGGGADIGTSFGLLGTGDSTFVTAGRSFTGGPLSDGQTFSAGMVVNFRGGFKGLSLKNGSTDVATLNIGGDDYQFNGANISGLSGATGDWGYNSNTILQFSATVTGSDLLVNITRSGGTSASYSTTLAGMGVNLDNFSMFSGFTGTDAQNNLYVNNLSVVPEPAAITLLGLGFTLIAVRRRRSTRYHRAP